MKELVVGPKLSQKVAYYFSLMVAIIWSCISIWSAIVLLPDETILASFMIVLAIVFWCFIILGARFFMRTLIFCSDGCAVKFFGKSKFYAWSEIVAKRIDIVKSRQGESYRKGICLSTNPKDRDVINGYSNNSRLPRIKGLCVYLVFEKNIKFTVPLRYRNFYLVDEDTLMTALREWGIDYDLA